MTILLKILLLHVVGGLSALLKEIFTDWRTTKSSESFVSSTTPFERMKYNAVFFSIASCILIVVLASIFIIFSKVDITFPFWS